MILFSLLVYIDDYGRSTKLTEDEFYGDAIAELQQEAVRMNVRSGLMDLIEEVVNEHPDQDPSIIERTIRDYVDNGNGLDKLASMDILPQEKLLELNTMGAILSEKKYEGGLATGTRADGQDTMASTPAKAARNQTAFPLSPGTAQDGGSSMLMNGTRQAGTGSRAMQGKRGANGTLQTPSSRLVAFKNINPDAAKRNTANDIIDQAA